MQYERGKSTGPKTSRGKQRSSENSTAHGMRSKVVRLLPGESPEDAVRDLWTSQYGEFTEEDAGFASLLTTLIDCDWMQKRAMRLVAEAEFKFIEAQESDEPEERVDKLLNRLQLMMRYKTQHENSFQRALRAIEQFEGRRFREEMAARRTEVIERKAVEEITSILIREGRSLPGADGFAVPLSDVEKPEPITPPKGRVDA